MDTRFSNMLLEQGFWRYMERLGEAKAKDKDSKNK